MVEYRTQQTRLSAIGVGGFGRGGDERKGKSVGRLVCMYSGRGCYRGLKDWLERAKEKYYERRQTYFAGLERKRRRSTELI